MQAEAAPGAPPAAAAGEASARAHDRIEVDVDPPALQLPDDLLLMILERGDIFDRIAVAGVCRRWRTAVLSPGVCLALTIIGDERGGRPRRVSELGDLVESLMRERYASLWLSNSHDAEYRTSSAMAASFREDIAALDGRQRAALALPVERAAALLRGLPSKLREAARELDLTVFFVRGPVVRHVGEDVAVDYKLTSLLLLYVLEAVTPSGSFERLALRLPAPLGATNPTEVGCLLRFLGPTLDERLPSLESISLYERGALGRCRPDQLQAFPRVTSLRACLCLWDASPANLAAIQSTSVARVASCHVRPPPGADTAAAAAEALSLLARRGIKCRSLRLSSLDLRDTAALCAVLRPAADGFGPEDGPAQLELENCILPDSIPVGDLVGLETLAVNWPVYNLPGLRNFCGIASLKKVFLRDMEPSLGTYAEALFEVLEGVPTHVVVAVETAWPAPVLARFLRRLAAHPALLRHVDVDFDATMRRALEPAEREGMLAAIEELTRCRGASGC